MLKVWTEDMKLFACTSPTLQNNDLFIALLLCPDPGRAKTCGSGSGSETLLKRQYYCSTIKRVNPARPFFFVIPIAKWYLFRSTSTPRTSWPPRLSWALRRGFCPCRAGQPGPAWPRSSSPTRRTTPSLIGEGRGMRVHVWIKMGVCICVCNVNVWMCVRSLSFLKSYSYCIFIDCHSCIY